MDTIAAQERPRAPGATARFVKAAVAAAVALALTLGLAGPASAVTSPKYSVGVDCNSHMNLIRIFSTQFRMNMGGYEQMEMRVWLWSRTQNRYVFTRSSGTWNYKQETTAAWSAVFDWPLIYTDGSAPPPDHYYVLIVYTWKVWNAQTGNWETTTRNVWPTIYGYNGTVASDCNTLGYSLTFPVYAIPGVP